MGGLQLGGGSSAVAASTHAACERFRKTDPIVTGRTRRALAAELGHPDTSAGIPEARWMRAMAFERLVHHERFVSRLLTTAVGQLKLRRPTQVQRADGGVAAERTAAILEAAHHAAVDDGTATMVTSLAVPFVGMEGVDGATAVKPDFAIIAARYAEPAGAAEAQDDGEQPEPEIIGSWLVMGDAKDYERVRSRIDDGRMLKGFLQVALGAESAAAWSALPDGMAVHDWGVLAVPRNAFLQPEPIVERLDDHRTEVRGRVDERQQLLADLGTTPFEGDISDFVAHLKATYDPATCPTCSMFNHCRAELRASTEPGALLIELGVAPGHRPGLASLLDGGAPSPAAPPSLVAAVKASIDGEAQWTGQRRTDLAGLPGTIDVVLAKSDAAALGVHGMALRGVDLDGTRQPWAVHVFDDPQSAPTRLEVLQILGEAIAAARATTADTGSPQPVVIATPDGPTGDVLVSMADSVAGVETSRLRWERDIEQGREPLTFDGTPAVVPDPLSDAQRLAVSFLLEQDRARALRLRSPLVDLRSVLASHLVPGGPATDRGRLDYLVAWAEAPKALDHRAVSDEIAASEHTPGARLGNDRSDAIHQALRGSSSRKGRSVADPERYAQLVCEELAYKSDVVDRAHAVLDKLEVSKLRRAHRELEGAAQELWSRREAFHASDLIRFGRVANWWRNNQVELLEGDAKCNVQLQVLANTQSAREMAVAAGTREVALATVTSVDPIRLAVQSRRLQGGSTVFAIHHNGAPVLERVGEMKVQGGSFKFSKVPLGLLVDDDGEADLGWDPGITFDVEVGDELILADAAWFAGTGKGYVNVGRPPLDKSAAPKSGCEPGDYADDPDSHTWCCRPQESTEAWIADDIAERRERGELNPEVWPPLLDIEQFDVLAGDEPGPDDVDDDIPTRPEGLTLDELD